MAEPSEPVAPGPSEPEAAYIEEILGRDGVLARSWEGFRWREGQTMGAYPIDGAIRSRTRILIEAPTGTGKTLMYLVPAIYHAARHGRRVLVVTANLTLQRQLIEKDLPRLAQTLPWRFRYAELKGRQNFICRKRADEERAQPASWTEAQRDQVRRLLVWEETDRSGDKSRLPYTIDHQVDRRLFVRSEECDRDRCKFFGKDEDRERDLPRCFAEVARAEAMAAQIVVTNYAMLCLHLRGYATVVPPFDIAILDEAHVAADIARERFGFDMRPGAFPHAVGLLKSISKENEDGDDDAIEMPGEPPASLIEEENDEPDLPPLDAPPVEDISHVDPAALARDILDRGQKFFLRLNDLRENAPIALPTADFVADWPELVRLLRLAVRVYESKSNRLDIGSAHGRALARRCDTARDNCTQLANRIECAMTLAEPERFVYFVGEDEEQRLALSQRALLVGEWFREKLFTAERTVILTSATLRTNGSFRHICMEVGLDETTVTTFFLPTPFNMGEQARLIVPAPDNRKMPAPTERGFDAMVVRMIRHAIRLAKGRTMALFTSRKRLRYVAANLGEVGYRVLVQGDMERGALLAEFQRDVSSVLLATGSFWAGVDVPGEALSCLIIDKLPFEQEDPLSQAIRVQLQKRNLSPFQHWHIPRAILTLKQGLGRLIRTTEDRGVMMVLDNRLTQKSYGGQFLRSLDLPPSCIVYRSEVIAEFLSTGLDPGEATEPSGD
jgi:ATP-dependent DNA helicase DinG